MINHPKDLKTAVLTFPDNPTQAMAFVVERLEVIGFDLGTEYHGEASKVFVQPIEAVNFVEMEC